MKTTPFGFDVSLPSGTPSYFEKHLTRTLSSMKGQFLDIKSFDSALSREDILLYEVYEISRPEEPGEIIQGTSIVHPGVIGNEYYMTKGHFHTILETAEIYYCLQGNGMMVMETKNGDWSVEELQPGRFLYVPPSWAHRSVNTSLEQDLITIFFYPGNAGHDYGTIETTGFRKLILENNGKPTIVDNPRWNVN
jgi:glucose-6-phosphate isomerase, archaeal